jgi:uncharacterized protein YeaO (DUF488 family)
MSSRKRRIDIARVYDAPAAEGSFRVLVDRIWPRGVKKEALQLDAWMKDLAPSSALRKWFNHDPARWDEFRTRYFAELADKDALIAGLLEQAKRKPLLLLFGARDEQHNNAVALREYLQGRVES